MNSSQQSTSGMRLHAENLGGIDDTTVQLHPGVNVLVGRNATNRSSFLRAVMAALGSDRASLKADADEGRVELTLDGNRYTRTFTREGDRVVTDGDPYLDDPEAADLFAFLTENNEARRAVERGDDLREMIMRPVDTDAIQAEIDQLVDERREMEDRIEDLDTLKDERADLKERQQQIRDAIAEKRAELADKRDELEAAEVNVEEHEEEQAEIQDSLDELQSVRSDLESVRFDIETQRESLETLRDDRDEIQADLADLPSEDTDDIDDIESKIAQLRARKSEFEDDIDDLRSIIRFNEETLEDRSDDVIQALEETDDTETAGDVTDQLLPDDTVVCWTCGSEVGTGMIEATLNHLRELQKTKLDDRSDIDDRIAELREERDELQDLRQRRERLESKLDDIRVEIDRREERLEELVDRRGDLEEQVADLKAEVEELDQEEFSDVLDQQREVNELEFEIERQEENLATVKERIENIDNRLAERDDLNARREEIRTELENLRTRIDSIEADAVDAFNDHMESVLEKLEYANIERIWIERSQKETKQGRGSTEKSTFDMHVVRSTESGNVYEDTVAHLSESEREVTGLVFGLAGYLVHDIHETVPVMILDSLEAIDAERIATLVEYFDDYTDYLVVALLPEDAATLDDEYHQITAI